MPSGSPDFRPGLIWAGPTGLISADVNRIGDREELSGRKRPIVLGIVIRFWGVLLAPPLLAVVHTYPDRLRLGR